MARLVDTLAAAHAARVKPALIRTWATRGHLEPHGRDARGRTLYRLDDVYRAAARRSSTSRAQPVDDSSTNV
ncbi:hypothetical protein GCM10009592_26650 [Brachybacterium rhamnosum]|uniref:MerR family transcriptional regulator n=1 Tax=Brachybacterium rhamnosum TaxID=173361 RepID=A0ABW4Q1E4_9MICO